MKRQPKKPLSVHVGLAIAEIVCVSAFVIELSRALSGNMLSWAYVFEWPVLGGYAVHMWRKLGAETMIPSTPRSEDDDTLRAYNEYLAHVHEPSTEHPNLPRAN
jgi:hypothetical protein